MSKYRRMTLAVRCQIDSLLQVGFSVKDVSLRTGFNKSSIYRELSRNSVGQRYCPKLATSFYIQRQKFQGRKLKIQNKLEEVVLDKLLQSWSPEQISGRLSRDKIASISHETIYKYINRNPDLRGCLRKTRRRGHGRYSQRKRRWKDKLHISQRPAAANNRERIGDWERDMMFGINRQQLLVCTDRKSKYTKVSFMKKFCSSWVNVETKRLLTQTGKKAHTITNDNGTEFRGKKDIGIPIYYCTPMKPQQRGTVENTVGLLRQFISRQTDIKKLKAEDLNHLESLLNHRPRKGLDYLTPHEVFYGKRVALDY